MSRYEFSGITEQRKAAIKRRLDAEFLLDRNPKDLNWLRRPGKHALGAMYLAGYAVECKLKAIAMEINKCNTLDELREKWGVSEHDIYTHGLESLATQLKLYAKLKASPVWRDFAEINRWRPSWRYDPKEWNNGTAAEFVDAVKRVYNWLESNHC